jgi:hypothetical protein
MARVPVVGEIIVSPRNGTELILDVAFSRDGTAHIFVMPALVPPHVARGLGTGEGSMPSIVGFEGKTVGHLLNFFSRFPADYPISTSNHEILVARSKGGMVLLRFDDPVE